LSPANTRLPPGITRGGPKKGSRGHDDFQNVDFASDQFRLAAPWTEKTFRSRCDELTDAEAAPLPRSPTSSTLGLTWHEGNVSWTRYNHLLPPGRKTCINGVTWNGVAMTGSSRHGAVVGLLMGDGSVRFVSSGVGPQVWKALATIAGGETLAGGSY
jgi:hypothetical protein